MLALFLVYLSALGQRRVLMLEKNNLNKSAYYEAGDELIFYRKGKRKKTKDTILSLEDSMIVFRGYRVPLTQVTALHIDDKTRWWLRFKPAQLLLIGGAGYVAIDAVNGQGFNQNTLAIGGAMMGAGLLFRLFIPNKLTIGKRTKLSILTL